MQTSGQLNKNSYPFKLSKESIPEILTKYEELCGGTPDAFYLLARGVVESKTLPGKYESGGYEDLDAQKLLSGGKAVSSAGAQLHKYFPQTLIVANTKLPQGREPYSNALVYQEELIAQSVNPKNILLQENSYSTFTEIGEMIKLIISRDLHHVVILTNEFQIERAKAFLGKIETLQDPNGYSQNTDFREAIKQFKMIQFQPKIIFVSAEDILSLCSKYNASLIEKVKETPTWIKRVASENQGAVDILNGTYWTQNNSKYFIKPTPS